VTLEELDASLPEELRVRAEDIPRILARLGYRDAPQGQGPERKVT
jgi:hypothetical protein